MQIPNQSPVLAFGRHVVSAGSGAVAYASLLHLFQNPTDAQAATNAISQIGHGFSEIVGGSAVLVPIAMGVLAALKSSPLVQFALSAAAMLRAHSDTSNLTTDEQKTIMQATEKLPKVAQVVTNDPVIADITPEKNIVMSLAK